MLEPEQNRKELWPLPSRNLHSKVNHIEAHGWMSQQPLHSTYFKYLLCGNIMLYDSKGWLHDFEPGWLGGQCCCKKNMKELERKELINFWWRLYRNNVWKDMESTVRSFNKQLYRISLWWGKEQMEMWTGPNRLGYLKNLMEIKQPGLAIEINEDPLEIIGWKGNKNRRKSH